MLNSHLFENHSWASSWKHFYGLTPTHSPFVIVFLGLFQSVKKGIEIGEVELGETARIKKIFRIVSMSRIAGEKNIYSKFWNHYKWSIIL